MTSTSTQTVLSADNLTKSFGTFTAVRGASVSVHRGEVVAIIGPNGAGKTTFFDLLTGRKTPDSGTVSIFGKDVTRMPPWRRSEEHTSELQSLMRISYAVFCLKKKT